MVGLTTRQGEAKKESGVTAMVEVRRWAGEPESRMSKSIFPTGKEYSHRDCCGIGTAVVSAVTAVPTVVDTSELFALFE